VQSVIKKITSKHLQKIFQYFAKTGLKVKKPAKTELMLVTHAQETCTRNLCNKQLILE